MVREKRGLRCIAFSGYSPSCLHPSAGVRQVVRVGSGRAGRIQNLYPSLAYSVRFTRKRKTSLSREEILPCDFELCWWNI